MIFCLTCILILNYRMKKAPFVRKEPFFTRNVFLFVRFVKAEGSDLMSRACLKRNPELKKR